MCGQAGGGRVFFFFPSLLGRYLLEKIVFLQEDTQITYVWPALARAVPFSFAFFFFLFFTKPVQARVLHQRARLKSLR
jgi:hypothetical protein